MRFLTFKDYGLQIQREDLFQILGERRSDFHFTFEDIKEETKEILVDAEMTAQEEISSYLKGRYIVEHIFAPTQEWSSGSTYFGKNLVYYNEPTYSSATTYNIGDRLSYYDKIYECLSGGTSGITPSASTSFSYIVNNNEYFYTNLPCQEYKVINNYKQGDIVWFEDNIYQAVQGVRGKNPAQSQNLELRYGIPSAQGYSGLYPETNLSQNTFPDIAINPLPNVADNYWRLYNGPVSSWFTGTTYYFSGVQPTNTTYFTKGDNRNAQIKLYLIDIILYHLHSRINPRNMPELRAIRYDGNNQFQTGGAIGWMKNVEKGKVNLDCPEIEPNQGGNIRWGSYPKNNNQY